MWVLPLPCANVQRLANDDQRTPSYEPPTARDSSRDNLFRARRTLDKDVYEPIVCVVYIDVRFISFMYVIPAVKIRESVYGRFISFMYVIPAVKIRESVYGRFISFTHQHLNYLKIEGPALEKFICAGRRHKGPHRLRVAETRSPCTQCLRVLRVGGIFLQNYLNIEAPEMWKCTATPATTAPWNTVLP
jgi:hypothetical protein